jgi:hypothetical protein
MVPNNKMQKRFWIFTLEADCIDAPLSASKFSGSYAVILPL